MFSFSVDLTDTAESLVLAICAIYAAFATFGEVSMEDKKEWEKVSWRGDESKECE